MTISNDLRLTVEVLGLQSVLELVKKFSTTAEATAVTHQNRTLAAADTAEALDLGDVATAEMIIIIAIDYDLEVDCDFVSSFDADIIIHAGEFAVFKPSGVVQVKNQDAGESVNYEYIILGTT